MTDKTLEQIKMESGLIKNKDTFQENTKSITELLGMKPKDNMFVVDKIVVENEINAITAKTGVGKSLFIFKMALDIAEGIPFLGQYETKKNKVLILDLEMSENSILDRVHTIAKDKKDIDVDIFYKGDFMLDDAEHTDSLIKIIKEKRYGVVFFDTLSAAHGKEENSNTEMVVVLKTMRRIISETNCTIIFNHHHGKNRDLSGAQQSRGATGIIDKTASSLTLTKGSDKVVVDILGNQQRAFHILVEQTKKRERQSLKSFGVDIWWDEITKTTTFKHTGDVEDDDMEGKAIKFIMDFITEDEKYTRDELIEWGGKKQIGKTNIENAITQLLTNKYLDRNKFKEMPSRGYYYFRRVEVDNSLIEE